MKTLLAYLIQATGLTQKELARGLTATGSPISQSTLSAASLGGTMRPTTAAGLAKAFHVRPEELQLPVGGAPVKRSPATACSVPVCAIDSHSDPLPTPNADDRAWRPKYIHINDDGSTDEVDIAHSMCLEEALATCYSLIDEGISPPAAFVLHRSGLRIACSATPQAAFRRKALEGAPSA